MPDIERSRGGGPVGLQVVGLRDLQRALREASAAGGETTKLIRVANLEAARLAVPFVRALAPRGEHEGGGQIVPIIDSIRAIAGNRAGFVAAGGAKTPHAGVWNYGGAIPRRGSGGQRRQHIRGGRAVQHAGNVTHIPPRPYMEPGIALAIGSGTVDRPYLEALERIVGILER